MDETETNNDGSETHKNLETMDSGCEELQDGEDDQQFSGDEVDDDDGDESDYEYEDDTPAPFDAEADKALAKAIDELQKSSPEAIAMKQVEQSPDATSGQRRLAKDMYKILKSDTTEAGFKMEPASDDSMQKWRIELFGFDADSDLAKDLHVLGLKGVVLSMEFPTDYPHEPPFVHVVTPRFARRTGHVFDGALCMELLTKSGWNPINDIESVIVSIRSLLVVGKGRLESALRLSPQDYQARCAKASNDKIAGDEQNYTEAQAKRGLQTVESVHGRAGTWAPVAGGS